MGAADPHGARGHAAHPAAGGAARPVARARRRGLRRLALAAVLAGGCGSAFANTGLSLLGMAWPLQWLALLPVVAIESVVLVRVLKLAAGRGSWLTAQANFVSTLVGVPIAWVLDFLLLVFAATGAPFLSDGLRALPLLDALVGGPGSGFEGLKLLGMLVFFCWLSYAIEASLLAGWLPQVPRPQLRRAVALANVVSYLALALAAVVLTLLPR